jgi:hypothetical protein
MEYLDGMRTARIDYLVRVHENARKCEVLI